MCCSEKLKRFDRETNQNGKYREYFIESPNYSGNVKFAMKQETGKCVRLTFEKAIKLLLFD